MISVNKENEILNKLMHLYGILFKHKDYLLEI